jgi:hypothetical protein
MTLSSAMRSMPCRLAAVSWAGLCCLAPAAAQTLLPLSCEVIVDNPGGGGGNMQVLDGKLELAAGIARPSAIGPEALRRRVAYSYRFGNLDALLPEDFGRFAASSVRVQVIKGRPTAGEPPVSQLASTRTLNFSAAPRAVAFSGASRESLTPQVDGGSGGSATTFPERWTIRLRVLGLRNAPGAKSKAVAARIDANCTLPVAAGG